MSNAEYGRDWITWRDSPSRVHATPWCLRPLSGSPASYGDKDERPQQEQEATAERSHAQYRSDSSRPSSKASQSSSCFFNVSVFLLIDARSRNRFENSPALEIRYGRRSSRAITPERVLSISQGFIISLTLSITFPLCSISKFVFRFSKRFERSIGTSLR